MYVCVRNTIRVFGTQTFPYGTFASESARGPPVTLYEVRTTIV